MKLTIVSKVVMVMCLWLWLTTSTRGNEDSGGQSQLSISEMEKRTVEELEHEQARLTRLLSDSDPFKQHPESWKSTIEHLAKARMIGKIVQMQYLVRIRKVKEAPASKRIAFPTKFEPPSDPVRITVVQRRSKPIPGFHGAIKVKIGDITHGQVLFEIVSEEFLKPVVDMVSVQEGDVIPFNLGDVEYYLTVFELRNLMVGDDFAVFDVSTKRPDQSSEIEQLLNVIESSELVFIRNDKDATSAKAAAHMRKKWRSIAPPITTVQGFIEKVTSRSSLTDKPYKVKLADGSVIELRTWLRQQLREIRQRPKR